jgi:2-C-methyl-D-erythritol 4-phosphate cytidylyltransferase
MKSTVKEVGEDMMVIRTPDRSLLWDVQTPQARSSVYPGGLHKP